MRKVSRGNMGCSAQVWLNPIWSCGQNALQLSKCCHPPLYSPSLNPRVCTRGLYSIRVFFILFRRGGGSSLGRHLRGNRFSFESGPPDGPLIAPDHLRWVPLIDVTVEIGLWAKGLDTDVMRVNPFVKWLSPRVGPTYHNWHNEFYRGAILLPELLITEMSVIISGGTAYSTIRAGLNGRR